MSDGSSFQRLYQELSRAMQLRATGSFGRSGHLRDLVVLIPLDVVQDKDGARPFRERRNRALEVDGVVHAGLASLGLRLTRRVVAVVCARLVAHLVFLTPLVAPNVAEHQVHGQAVDPAGQRRLTAERREPLPQMDEDVLRQLARTRAGATHAQTEREYTP